PRSRARAGARRRAGSRPTSDSRPEGREAKSAGPDPRAPAGPARTVAAVIPRLDPISARAREEESRLGYFATLYRNATVEVKRGIAQGRFEDGARMERLDVSFATRYLRALAASEQNEPTPMCWAAAFRAATEWPPVVLQHLL